MKEDALTLAATSIRTELRERHPDTVFSVRSRRYSGGDSVSVRWAKGPSAEEVGKITRKYEQGYFDGNTDSYVRDEDSQHLEFHRLRGSTKYVFLQRRRV